MIIHTRVGRAAKFVNKDRCKNGAIKLSDEFIGKKVVVLSLDEHRKTKRRMNFLNKKLNNINKLSKIN